MTAPDGGTPAGMTARAGEEAAPFRTALASATHTIERLRDRIRDLEARAAEPIAVVGMALRMPGGAETPTQFWRVLRQGTDVTREFPASRGDARSAYHPDPEHPGSAYVIRGGFLGEIDGFDPAAFGISPREAVGMDPQQRIVLELAWEALERAGYAPTSLAGSRAGVYVGASTTDYVRMRQQLGDIRDVDAYQLTGEPSFIAGRVSYTLGLRGPSEVIDTTCSSSLVAVHTACQALRSGDADLALAGGVNLMLSPYGFVLMSKFRALAADGRCKTFDATADGYARGEGAGLVVLKRLRDAASARDAILAVIRGSAVNHDGRSSGLTVPNPDAQQDVIRRALAQAGLAPKDVGYVEAHGTGTSLGDPIELRALDTVLRESRDPAAPLLVGSVKTNIGHLEAAAGIAGLLKVILALQHGEIPPHLNLATPNPKIPWRRLHLKVPTAVVPWPPGSRPRIAGVSSFGASGTNAHMLVGEPDPVPEPPERPERSHVLVISARTQTALRELAARHADQLTAGRDRLDDLSFTSQVGRARLAYGAAVAGRDRLDLAGHLAAFARGGNGHRVTEISAAPHRHRKAGWLLTGQGAQFPGMGAGLRGEPAFWEPLRECLELLAPMMPLPVEQVLWGGTSENAIHHTRFAQPALFALEYALGRALLSWLPRPDALLGHSVGEITAACLAGAIDLPDAARLVAHRARLMGELPAGGVMIAVSCDEATARAAIDGLGDRVALAAVNGPADIVLSGAADDVRAVVEKLASAGFRGRPLTVSHAFHSALLRPMLDAFAEVVDSITVRPPEIPLVSNVTGRFWTAGQLDPRYWLRHAVETVRFADGLARLHEEGIRTFVEVGPRPVLTGLGRRAIDDPACAWISLLGGSGDDWEQVLTGLGALHLRGHQVQWAALHDREVRRVPAPTYPWDRERFWFRPAEFPAGSPADRAEGLGVRLRGPEPVFEETTQTGHVAAAGHALGWLAERAVRAAVAAGGGRWRQLRDADVDPALPHEAQGPWHLHTAVRPAAGRQVAVGVWGTRPETARGGGAWNQHGSIVLRRVPDDPAAGGEGSGNSDGPAGTGRWPVPDGEVSHPAAWGRVIQSACAAVGAACGQPGGWPHAFGLARSDVPEDVREIQVSRLSRAGQGWSADALLYTADGTQAGEITGLRWDPLPEPRPTRWYPDDELVYRPEWIPAPGAEAGQAGSRPHVVLVGRSHTELLAGGLRDRGASCVVVSPGDLAAPESLDTWLDQVPTHVLISGLDIPSGPELTAAGLEADGLAAEQLVIRLVQRITARHWPAGPPRIVLVTRGAVAAGTQARHSPAAAALWGLGRVIALEHPECWGSAIDADPGPGSGAGLDPAALAALVLDGSTEDQWALREGRPYVLRLRPVPAATLPAPARRRPHRPGTVLITGGLGGIGTAVARWLATTGTERIVLASRSGLPAETTWDAPGLPAEASGRIAAIRELRELGTRVEVAELDVTDEAAVRSLAGRLAHGPLPLRGVVHAAGLSDPQDLADADPQRYQRVRAPKAAGAWLLHESTRGLDLDFFICFSSIAATWGSAHLASYAAANNILDGLAHHRAAMGLPSLTVDWGPWGLPSHLFGDDVMTFLESVGLRRLDPAQCLGLLSRLLQAGGAQYVVCAVDWDRYKPVMEARNDRPILAEISLNSPEGATDQDQALLASLRARAGDTPDDRAARRALLADVLRAAAASALGLDAGSITADADLFGLGLDSLMVMDIVATCRRRLGAAPRPAGFFARSTLAEWADHLDGVVRGTAEPAAQDGAPDDAAGDDGFQAAAPDRYAETAAIRPQAVLAADVCGPPPGVPAADPGVVLLTGATGYIGAYLLDELLATSDAGIACLVRCASPGTGLARLRRNVETYLPWRDGAEQRIRVIPGNLAQPLLGLPPGDFGALADEVDAIYHAGAWVDFVHTFDQVAPANIGGTQELLRLATRGKPKAFEHVSTYGIWGIPEPGRTTITETADIATAGRLLTGYVQSKWGAEELIRQARERGIAARVYRPGRVLGDSRTGACLTTHFTCRVIKGCIQLGIAPDLGDLEIEMTPVDYVAKAMIFISRASQTSGAFHLVNPRKMPFAWLVRFIQGQGWPVRVVDRQEWWSALRRSFGDKPNELHPVMDVVREFVVGGEEAIDYDVTCAEKVLAGSAVTCPPLDERLLETYFGYFVRSGYLTRPLSRKETPHG